MLNDRTSTAENDKMHSLHDALNDSFQTTVADIADDMALFMFGAGDVQPDMVDPEAVRLLSALTVQFIGRLVDAAIDSREMMLDHQHVFSKGSKTLTTSNLGKCSKQEIGLRPDPPLPPPIFCKSRQPSTPCPPSDNHSFGNDDMNYGYSSNNSASNEKKRAITSKRKRSPNIEYWDNPLPEPKIRRNSNFQVDATNAVDMSCYVENHEANGDGVDVVGVDDWVGLSGVDLFENRIRAVVQRQLRHNPSSSLFAMMCIRMDGYAKFKQ
jgi:hypothetical protein